MKKILLVVCSMLMLNQIYAQQASPICGTSEAMADYYASSPLAADQRIAFEKFTKDYISNSAAAKTTADSFVIPVVFHVYGTVQGGYNINDPLIELALKGVNEDFQGLNADFGTVHTQFMPLRSTFNIRFALAKKDPSGNATTGILYYPTKAGYGKTTVNNEIAADAWDNTMYMNVYIMHDLYDNGIFNNSGIAWYPDIDMTNNKIARVVYNGQYLATNNTVNPEFASVFTHEFAHFFNLIHIFDGGCTAPNDNVADTPPCTTAQGCHSSSTGSTPLNCNSQLINAENYMDYNTNCYKMFTKGQTDRLEAAAQHPARITLWQESNLIATGVHQQSGIETAPSNAGVQVYPTISAEGIFHVGLSSPGSYEIEITDLSGKIVHNSTAAAGVVTLDLSRQAKGMYFMKVQTGNSIHSFKLILQ